MTEWYGPSGIWTPEAFERHHIYDSAMEKLLVQFCEKEQKRFFLNCGRHSPFRVYDFGCGQGHYITAIASQLSRLGGVCEFVGIDGCRIALDQKPEMQLRFEESTDLTLPNLQTDLKLEACDIGICLEVAEHIPPDLCGQFLDNLTNMCASKLILSWAIPGQGGLGHVNEKVREFVVEMMQARGFSDITEAPGGQWPWGLAGMGWFHRTMVFERA